MITPAITTNLTGGYSPIQKGLQMAVDFANTNQTVTVNIKFNYPRGVDTVSFTNFDVDFSAATGNHYIDQIRNITGTFGGTTNAATLTAVAGGGASFSIVSNGTINAKATGTGTAANNSNTGDLGINFGANTVSNVSYTYGNGGVDWGGTPTVNNPTLQWITMHDISFQPKPVPEVATLWGMLGATGLVLGWRYRKKLQRSEKSKPLA